MPLEIINDIYNESDDLSIEQGGIITKFCCLKFSYEKEKTSAKRASKKA